MGESASARLKERRISLQGQNRCIACGKKDELTLKGRCLCAGCTARQRQSSRRYYESHKTEMLAYQKQKREEHRANGECVSCGKKKRSGDAHSLCHECRLKHAERKREEYERKNAERRWNISGTVEENGESVWA